MSETQIDVSIIIVNWNVAELLAKCLDTILASPLVLNIPDGNKPVVEIIVVDSASQDNSVELIRKHYPQVKMLAQTENVGFPRGNNVGFGVAQGRYLFLLNPDTEVIGDAIPRMMAYMDENENIGIVGPHTLNTDGRTQSSRRRFPTKLLAFFESTWLQPFTPKKMLTHFYVTDAIDNSVIDVDWVQGSAMMVRREVYAQIGGMDTDFVMYSEELDWCKRAKDAGWRVVYFGEAQIIHHGGKSSEQVNTFKHIEFQRSKLLYFRKHHGTLFAFILRVFLLLNYGWQLGLETFKSLLGHKREMRRERIKTYWQVLRSGLKVN